MRTIFIAMLLALGIGLLGAPSANSAPISAGASAIVNPAGEISPVVQARWHCRRHHHRHSRHSRRCWRW